MPFIRIELSTIWYSQSVHPILTTICNNGHACLWAWMGLSTCLQSLHGTRHGALGWWRHRTTVVKTHKVNHHWVRLFIRIASSDQVQRQQQRDEPVRENTHLVLDTLASRLRSYHSIVGVESLVFRVIRIQLIYIQSIVCTSEWNYQ